MTKAEYLYCLSDVLTTINKNIDRFITKSNEDNYQLLASMIYSSAMNFNGLVKASNLDHYEFNTLIDFVTDFILSIHSNIDYSEETYDSLIAQLENCNYMIMYHLERV